MLLDFTAVPNWEKWLGRLSKPASPIVMIIALSAMRGIQLSREAAGFRNGCTTAKLFAKHIKVKIIHLPAGVSCTVYFAEQRACYK